MANETTIVAEKREKLGSAESRRLRQQGRIPAVVYGHKQGNVPVTVESELLTSLIEKGEQVVDLSIDDGHETAIIRDLQWDPFNTHIQHIDFLRVDPNERVTVDVTIELRGIAPGVLAGGVLEHHLHALSIECPAVRIPKSIVVRIQNLEIDNAVHVSDLSLGEGVTTEVSPEEIVVRVVSPTEFVEPEEGEEGVGGPAEPELVGRKHEAEEED